MFWGCESKANLRRVTQPVAFIILMQVIAFASSTRGPDQVPDGQKWLMVRVPIFTFIMA